MSSTWRNRLSLTIFGESHGSAIGMTLEGIPAGQVIDLDVLQSFLDRRAPGRTPHSTPRYESDVPEFLSGIHNGSATGAPITAIIKNESARPENYMSLRNVPRPGHADYTAEMKYGGHQDPVGGGHFSGRLTAPLCIAGGIISQILARSNISICAHMLSVGTISGAQSDMLAKIDRVKGEGDSVGGVIECTITGHPAGLGDPIFLGMENRIASLVFGIPAVRGIEFGAGFAAATMQGSTHNDPFYFDNRIVKTRTNHHGGILGGITSGMPLLFRVAIKPTPSIARPQESVNLASGKPASVEIRGRHDPCILPRALPCIESAAAIAIYDAILESKGTRP